MVCIVPHFIIFLCYNFIFTYVFKHGCACLKLEFG